MAWEEFWDKLLEEHKLRQKVKEMDEVDELKGHTTRTEEICRCIYNDYDSWRSDCEKVNRDIWDIIEKFDGVHLHTKRIKSLESLIEKVINKRHEWLADDSHKYANIDVTNYRDIITDLVGLRLIINYRGRWVDIHNSILREFKMDENREYIEDKPLAHIPGQQFMAEIPKAYYAEGDDIEQYKSYGLLTKRHRMNYRSVHYTVSYEEMYVEIQVRTIYDEAWSDCDHNYVYKKDSNKSYTALVQLSGILSRLTNLSNDIGDQMKSIYDEELLVENMGNGWRTSEVVTMEMDRIVKRMKEIEDDLNAFRSKIMVGA